MGIKIEIEGANVSAVHQQMKDLLPPAATLSDFSLQELVVLVEKRAAQEGVDLSITLPGDRMSPADQRKAEARAKLRGELEGSLAPETGAETPSLDVEPAKAKGKKDAKSKAAAGNGKTESDEDRKNRLITKLGELFNEKTGANKAKVRGLMAEYGDGAKTFAAIPADQFAAIEEAMAKASWVE
jgi:hypothetical protein